MLRTFFLQWSIPNMAPLHSGIPSTTFVSTDSDITILSLNPADGQVPQSQGPGSRPSITGAHFQRSLSLYYLHITVLWVQPVSCLLRNPPNVKSHFRVNPRKASAKAFTMLKIYMGSVHSSGRSFSYWPTTDVKEAFQPNTNRPLSDRCV